MSRPSSIAPILTVFVLLLGSGCGSANGPANSGSEIANGNEKNALRLVATTGQIDSALRKITAGTDTNIKLFCGPGVDPHSFNASMNDIQSMQDADAILYNGFHLEAKLDEYFHSTFENKSWAMASAFPESMRLNWEEDGEVDPNAPFDPHIWNHLPGWAACVEQLIDYLGELSPDNAELFRKNGDAYIAEIMETHRWAEELLGRIPESSRVIISAHDAFNYFAVAYQMETHAVLGVGNDAEADIRTMQEVANLICERKVPVIFLETITNPKVTQALQEACEAKNWSVEIASQSLHSDDLGATAPQDTFLGAFRSNVEIISNSLSGTVNESP